jgi:hypothetical protein
MLEESEGGQGVSPYKTILGARKKILKDSLLLLFGEFPFFANLIMIVVGHGDKGKDWADTFILGSCCGTLHLE